MLKKSVNNPNTHFVIQSGFLLLIGLVIGQLVISSSQLSAMDHSDDPSALIGWKDVNGKLLPFQDNPTIELFLKESEVIWVKEIPTGVTNPQKILLEKDGIRVHAIFRSVNISKLRGPGREGRCRLNFRDSYRYEIAAYELSKLIGITRVPPTVHRKIGAKQGALQIWIEDCLMEKDRIKEQRMPPKPWKWTMQRQLLKIFDALIYNEDRNRGNLLIDPEWKLWFIDHTRSFRTDKQPFTLKGIRFCDRDIWSQFKSVDEETIRERLSPYIRSVEMEGVIHRYRLIVKHIEDRIQKFGENQVLFRFFD